MPVLYKFFSELVYCSNVAYVMNGCIEQETLNVCYGMGYRLNAKQWIELAGLW